MKGWNAYWFRPAPCIDLAVVRIIIVGTQLLLLLLHPTPNGGHADVDHLPDWMYDPITALRFFILPFGSDYRPSYTEIYFIQNVAIVAGCLALVGLMTRMALLIFAICNIFIVAWFYSFANYHHSEAPMFIALLVLAFSPAGQVLSVDARLRSRGSSRTSAAMLSEYSELVGWPILLIQWLFVLIYLSAVMSKLLFVGGLDWLNGYTLQYYLIQDSMRGSGSLMGAWFAQHHILVMLGQYGVILFQSTFVLAVIFPKLRWIYLPVGMGFHIANIVLLNALFPQWMAMYCVFIPWKRLFELLRERASVWRESPRSP